MLEAEAFLFLVCFVYHIHETMSQCVSCVIASFFATGNIRVWVGAGEGRCSDKCRTCNAGFTNVVQVHMVVT